MPRDGETPDSADLPALRAWIAEVLFARYPHVTYPGPGRLVAPCWYRHPYAVAELSALYSAWWYAYYNEDAPPTAANDWHKLLAEAATRVGPLITCPPGEHTDDPAVSW